MFVKISNSLLEAGKSSHRFLLGMGQYMRSYKQFDNLIFLSL